MRSFNFTSICILIGLLISCSSNSKNDSMNEISVNSTAEDEVVEESQTVYNFAPLAAESEDFTVSKEVSRKSIQEKTETVPQQYNFLVSLAANPVNRDDTHKLIKTVHTKFKVKNVPEAVYSIESIIIKNGGHIRISDIENIRPYSTTVNISKDSALLIHYSNLKANLTLRVHHTRLDTVLREIAPLAMVIDYRKVNANDVTIDLMREKLKRIRSDKKQKRISSAVDNKGKKLDNILEAEYAIDRALEEADNALIADYRMNDQIDYSTINIQLYQDESQHFEKVLRKKEIIEPEPSFSDKLVQSLSNGWSVVVGLFLLLIHLWPLLIIISAAAIIVIRIRKKNAK